MSQTVQIRFDVFTISPVCRYSYTVTTNFCDFLTFDCLRSTASSYRTLLLLFVIIIASRLDMCSFALLTHLCNRINMCVCVDEWSVVHVRCTRYASLSVASLHSTYFTKDGWIWRHWWFRLSFSLYATRLLLIFHFTYLLKKSQFSFSVRLHQSLVQILLLLRR